MYLSLWIYLILIIIVYPVDNCCRQVVYYTIVQFKPVHYHWQSLPPFGLRDFPVTKWCHCETYILDDKLHICHCTFRLAMTSKLLFLSHQFGWQRQLCSDKTATCSCSTVTNLYLWLQMSRLETANIVRDNKIASYFCIDQNGKRAESSEYV